MKIVHKISLLFLLLCFTGFAQDDVFEEDSVEVYVIDSFIPPDNPTVFNLSFFTSQPARSKVIFDDDIELAISDTLSEEHKIKIELTKISCKSKMVPYVIYVEDSAGKISSSEKFEFELQEEIKMEDESNFLLLCLFGGTVFLIPNPVLVITEDENFLRLGYKRIIETPGIQYISPGLNGFTNFNGFNGISPELSIGWFKIFNTFSVYTRYRFNFKPGESESNFHEISLGLYSSFFSFYF